MTRKKSEPNSTDETLPADKPDSAVTLSPLSGEAPELTETPKGLEPLDDETQRIVNDQATVMVNMVNHFSHKEQERVRMAQRRLASVELYNQILLSRDLSLKRQGIE